MAGIYIHIPFCKKACTYCNFHFSTSLKNKNEMLAAILHETELQRNFLANEKISSIYFGGGTPSILPTQDIESILQKIRNVFDVEQNIECTLEANPDDINSEKLAELKAEGINRLSIGIQSFFDEDLHYMNRTHSGMQAMECIEMAFQNGFTNFSIDLIFGYPLLTFEKWKQNIDTVLKYPIPHISCYAMTVEPKTVLDTMIKRQKLPPLNEEQSAEQYRYLIQRLCDAGYEHYEISNFAKPGKHAAHNSSYWQQEKYLGLGPSAHSYNGASRQWNVANNTKYIQSIRENIIPCEVEILSREERINEQIMISLRTSKGLNTLSLLPLMNNNEIENFEKKVNDYVNKNLLQRKDKIILLTDEGKLFADGIAADLFL